jgi:hypothetical protein
MRNAIIAILLMVCSTTWCDDNIRTIPSVYTFKEIYDSGVITRDVSGYIQTVSHTTGKTYTVTRDANNHISSFTDGTLTWTITRDANDRITSWSVT